VFDYRPYQKEAIESVARDLVNHQRVGAVLPTGAGKTEIFIGLVDQWLKSNPDKSVLVLSHLSLLTTQTSERFKSRTPHLSIGILQATQIPEKRVNVVISTMQSSRCEEKIKEFVDNTGTDIGLIIIDEAHYLTTDSYDKALSYFPQAKVFGVTATPFRSRQIMLNWFQTVSFNMALQDLIDQGFLVRPDLSQILMNSKLPEDILSFAVQLYKTKELGKKAVVFAKTKSDADLLRNMFVNEGIESESVTCDVNGAVRDDILERFRSGKTMVLTTVNVLSAGFDAPCLEAIIMPYPTKSPTLYMQRVGRGLRPSLGKSSCRVYVCGDAPSIARGIYNKIHTFAMNGEKEWRNHKTFLLDLLNNVADGNKKKYEWTEKLVEYCRVMEKWNLGNISEALMNKRFPKRYMEHLGTFISGLPAKGIPPSDAKASKQQISFLVKEGFEKQDVEKMTAPEAMAAIISLTEMQGKWKEEFRFTTGKFKGKKISETPLFYQEYVVKNFPRSHVAGAIQKFWREGGRRWA